MRTEYNRAMSLSKMFGFETLLHHITDIVSLVDRHGVYLYKSRAADIVLGYPRDYFIGRSCFEIVHPDDLSVLQAKFKEHVTHGTTYSPKVYRFRHFDGSWKYLEVKSANCLADENLQSLIIVCRDVTERVLQQEALIRKEQQYRNLFDHNIDAVYSIAPDGTFVSVNVATVAISGYSTEELLKLNFREIMHPAYLKLTEEFFLLAMSGKPQHYKSVIIDKYSKEVHLHITNIPIIIDGEVTGVYGIAKDITGQVKVEESLRNSEEFFRAIFQSSMSGVLIVNVDDGLIVEANEAACKLFNKSYSELNFSYLGALEKSGKENNTSMLELCRQHEEYRGEHLFVRADGSSIHAEFSLFRFKKFRFENSGGQHLYGIVIRDVTDWHRQEQEKRLLAQISKTFTESDLLEDALAKVLETICGFLDADFGEAWIPGFNNDRIELKAYWAHSLEEHTSYITYLRSLEVVKGGAINCKAWENRQTDWVENMDDIPEVLLRDRYRKEGFSTYVSMPIIFRNEVVAVLKVFSSNNTIRKELSGFINQLISHLAPEIQRKKTAEELNRFFELSPDMLCVIGMNSGLFLKSNNASQHILGYSSRELASLSYYQLIHPDDLSSFAVELEKLQREECVTYIENRFLCKDGTYKWLAWTGKPFGEERIVYAVAKDIDQIKKANEEIKRSALKLNNMIESISDGFYTLDKDWTFTYINQQFENVTCYTIKDLLGKKIWEINADIRDGSFCEHLQKAIDAQQTQNFEAYCDKASTWYAITAYPSEEGVSVYLRDITEAKTLQSMMVVERKVLEMNASSKAKLPHILDYFLNSMKEICKGVTCAVVMLNEQKTRLQCLSAPQIPISYRQQMKKLEVGKGKTSLANLYNRNQSHIVKDIQQAEPWAPYRPMLTELDLKAFWSFPIEASNNGVLATLIIFNRSNREPGTAELQIIDRVRGIIGLLIEKQQAEQALRKSHAALRKLTSYVQNAREQELKHLAREIHDELGQVLTALKIDITLLYRNIAYADNTPDFNEVREKVAEIMEVVNESISSVRKIVRDLRPVVLDDLGLISEIESRAQEFSRRMNIDVELLTEVDKLCLGQEKATEVFRILQESLTNIARHAQASKVRISIAHNARNQLLFEIEDNGKGFIMSQKNKQSFGLLGMHERALMIGGELTVKSIPGKGTKIMLTVPDHK